MERTLSIADLKQNLSRAIDDVATTGDTVVVSRNGIPVARIIPLASEPGIVTPRTEGDSIVFLQGDRPRFNTDRAFAQTIVEGFEAGAPAFRIPLANGHEVAFLGTAIDHILIPNHSHGGTMAPPTRQISITTKANVRFFIHEQTLASVEAQMFVHVRPNDAKMIRFTTYDRGTGRWGPHEAYIPADRIATLYLGGYK
jgi:prevent-host-death family protein